MLLLTGMSLHNSPLNSCWLRSCTSTSVCMNLIPVNISRIIILCRFVTPVLRRKSSGAHIFFTQTVSPPWARYPTAEQAQYSISNEWISRFTDLNLLAVNSNHSNHISQQKFPEKTCKALIKWTFMWQEHKQKCSRGLFLGWLLLKMVYTGKHLTPSQRTTRLRMPTWSFWFIWSHWLEVAGRPQLNLDGSESHREPFL